MIRKYLFNAILILFFLAGLSLLLYPAASDWWNSFHQSRAIETYAGEVSDLDETAYEKIWEAAQAYNQELSAGAIRQRMTVEEQAEYESLLNVTGSGMMGYIEIPKISCSLPVYHGSDEAVLQIAVGHLEGTSLPVGGEGSHCVLSSHRGLPSARLFTDLDELEEGDLFMLKVLNETLTYEVDQILVVEPDETEALERVEGKDYCTLVTCTPYGINSHRLLVRGHRVENQAQTVPGSGTAEKITPPWAASAAALLVMAAVIRRTVRRRRRRPGRP